MASKKKKSTKKKAAKPEPAKAPTIKLEPFTQSLACALKREEVEERAQRAAHLLADRDSREAAFKDERTAQKNQLDKLENEIRSLSQEVREKVTYREVRCERRYVYATGVVQDVRLDTGEILTERAMSDAERQRELDFDAKGPGGGDIDDEFHDESDEPSSDGASAPDETPGSPPDPDTAPAAPGAKPKKPKDDEEGSGDE